MAPRSRTLELRTYGVRLFVSNFRRSWSFYRETLGLRPAGGGTGEPPYGEFSAGNGTLIGLFDRRLMAKAVALEVDRPPARSMGRSALILSVADVDRLAARLTRRGVRVFRPPTDRPAWGLRTIHLRDPDGNLIEIFSRWRPSRSSR